MLYSSVEVYFFVIDSNCDCLKYWSKDVAWENLLVQYLVKTKQIDWL